MLLGSSALVQMHQTPNCGCGWYKALPYWSHSAVSFNAAMGHAEAS